MTKRPIKRFSSPGEGSRGHRRICLVRHELLSYVSLSYIYRSFLQQRDLYLITKRPIISFSLPGEGSRGHRRICLVRHDLHSCRPSLCHLWISLFVDKETYIIFLHKVRGLEGTDAFASFDMTSCHRSVCHICIGLSYNKETYTL